jgi:hypothetical protein
VNTPSNSADIARLPEEYRTFYHECITFIPASRMFCDPISTMAMALFSYFAKLFFLGLFLWALAKYTDREVIDRLSFGVAACALTIAWLGGEIASYLKLKTHLPLPPQAKP